MLPEFAPEQRGLPERLAQVFGRLAEVRDPEVDEVVTEMGFVRLIEETDGDVLVEFRLPTFWCSANFAYLMAEDMRAGISTLPWVGQVTVRLLDHFASEKISRGVSAGTAFENVFEDAKGNLTEVRRTFLMKAFLGRQDDLMSGLIPERGLVAVLAMTVQDLRGLVEGKHRLEVTRYLSLRGQFGGPADDTAPAFCQADGSAIPFDDFVTYRRTLRRTLTAQRANAELCKLTLQVRYGADTNVETLEKQVGKNNVR